ncbi:uncharacterized protein LOC119770042 [Culex quinquefasciatus]|uniref:uncharacterized protein LOC119770042 n=1 Tax=Culex quinquefasciatus TaxID=7176 RepID=UPI0018E3BDEE|nr:uncharacterized protein LOC119770042 [Culex quinquefasciatus]
MFHQVLIREADRSAQLFYWRDSPEKPLETMVTDVAIFGASCSPAHSQYVKNLNATEHEAEFPRAADAIRTKHYVEDYLDSVDTAEEAAAIALEVADVHAKAGFHIRNWVSNDDSVLQKIGTVNPTTVKRFVMDKDCGFERLLGMVWVPDEDVFTFRLNFRRDHAKLLTGEEIPTKQQALSIVMSIYDPTGFLAAFIVHGKIILQDVWRSRVDWKQKIPDELFQRWRQWIALLPKIEDLKIPRCYFPGYHPDSLRSLELHVFVDASESAYSAVAHFRKRVRCAFVSSKTKVAPLEPLSIPRLEANAGVLGVRLRKSIVTGHSLPITRTRFWTDSKTVLQWIRSMDLRRYRPYVAFRVNEILSMSAVEEWGYCPSRLNVADLAKKWGKQGPPLDIASPFYQSQEFVYDDPSEWPEPCDEMVELAPEELRSAFVFAHFVLKPLVKWERFSKWERLLRAMGYVHRFIDRKLNRAKKPWTTDLTREELQQAERSLCRIAQSDEYPDEVATLNQNQRVPAEQRRPLEKSSNIVKLCPMLDEAGVLRVKGRIQAADFVPYDARHPVILPRDHPVTALLLDYYHRRFQHANNETVVNEVRQKFSISKLRVQVRLTQNNCEWCKVYNSAPIAPQMAPLPRARLSPFLRPFTFTGVDYWTIFDQSWKKRCQEMDSTFTCLTIRAVHLEVVAGLSTDSFKKAMRRFIARRGAPQEIYSDRGTNFIGASGELAKEIVLNINQELSSTFTDAHTQWRFNPPAAPHMGGSWERMRMLIKNPLPQSFPADELERRATAGEGSRKRRCCFEEQLEPDSARIGRVLASMD